MTVSFSEAALGTEIEVPTLFGPEKIKIEAGTQPGTTITMKDKGIPHLNSYGKGAQIIFVNIYVPTSLSSKEKSLIKELAQGENLKPKKKSTHKQKDFFEKVKDTFF